MSAFSSVDQQLAVGIAQHRDRRHVGLRIAVDEVLPGRRQRDVVVGVLRREQRQALPSMSDLDTGDGSTGRAPSPCRRQEVQRARFFSSTRSSCVTLPSPVVIWCFSLPGLQVVEIELAPVVALGKPDDLVGRRQVAPVDAAVARFEERRDLLLEHVADRAGGGVGDAQLLVLVIARRRHERDVRAVGAPLHVAPCRRGRPRRRTASSGAGRAASGGGRRRGRRRR